MVLAIIDDRRQLSEKTRVVRGDNRELRATVNVQIIRIHELETEILEGRKKTEAPYEQLRKAES